jgi:predicted tellurium resistance membrane protein TerC
MNALAFVAIGLVAASVILAAITSQVTPDYLVLLGIFAVLFAGFGAQARHKAARAKTGKTE